VNEEKGRAGLRGPHRRWQSAVQHRAEVGGGEEEMEIVELGAGWLEA
jgi:hypothetical protein